MAAANTTPAYRKLTRLKRGLGTMSQLALGADHLLHVISTGYTETYRRFYLRDIQGILVVHTARRAIWTAVLCSAALFAILIILANGGGMMPIGIVFGVTVALLAWNLLRGGGCRLVIMTAVQQESVAAVTRLPKAKRVLAELRPLIEAAQADLMTAAAATSSPAAEEAVPPPVAINVPPALPPPLPGA